MTAVAPSDTGYTRVEPGLGAKARLKGARWVLVAAGLLLGVVVLGYLTRSDTDSIPMSTHNPDPTGTRALAQVAMDRGLSIRQIDSLVDARITSPDTTTLVMTRSGYLQSHQALSVLSYPGPIVVLGNSPEVARAMENTFQYQTRSGGLTDASCSDPGALAAGTIHSTGPQWIVPPDDAITCFPGDDGAVMVVVPREGKGTVTFVADESIAMNSEITTAGHAALMLRLIGGHENAVWYAGSMYDTTSLTWRDPNAGAPGQFEGVEPSTDFLPPGTGNALYGLALALIVVAWWRARRFGPIVYERLPVVVRAAETTRGRARMYRASRAFGRAAASLRAAAAVRMGQRVGVPRSADRETLSAALSRASGWTRDDVDSTLFGPPPRNEAEMMTLLTRIDTLENEVHRS